MADYPIVSDDPRIQAHYLACRAQGTSHALSEMFAFSCPPQANSDREWLMAMRQGHDSQAEGQERRFNYYREQAEAAGVNVTGLTYVPGVANRPGDPEAWVSGLGDLQRLVEKRGMSCEGRLNIQGPELENPPPRKVPIADGIVYDRACQMLDENPDLEGLAQSNPQEIMDQARDSLRENWQPVQAEFDATHKEAA